MSRLKLSGCGSGTVFQFQCYIAVKQTTSYISGIKLLKMLVNSVG